MMGCVGPHVAGPGWSLAGISQVSWSWKSGTFMIYIQRVIQTVQYYFMNKALNSFVLLQARLYCMILLSHERTQMYRRITPLFANPHNFVQSASDDYMSTSILVIKWYAGFLCETNTCNHWWCATNLRTAIFNREMVFNRLLGNGWSDLDDFYGRPLWNFDSAEMLEKSAL